jgi:hypothetical protein
MKNDETTKRKITVSLLQVRHGKFGGMESATYNLVNGLADLGCKLAIVYSD